MCIRDRKLSCSNADISGSISGQILISETLSLMSESYIQGDITTAKLSVEEGAQVDATIVMKTGKQLKAVETESINEKKSIVGTLGYFGLVGNFTKIIGFSLIGFSFLEYIDTFLLMIPATLLGSRIGQYLLDEISNKLFFYIFQIILIFLALRLLII